MSKTAKKYILVLDLGKDTIKALGFESNNSKPDPKSLKRVSFKTRSYDLAKGYVELQGNSHKVKYNDKEIIIGDQGIERSFDTSKTTPLHQVSAYAAITQYLQPDTKDNEIYMVLACPITVLRSDKAKSEYKQLIKGDGPISITVNDQNYEFEIKDILLKAESSGVIYLTPETFEGKKVAVIDFGGLNMTATVFTNGVCANPEKDRFAEEFGSVELIDRVSKHLTAYQKGNIVDFKTSEEALERGYLLDYGNKNNDSVQPIEDAKAEFLEDSFKLLDRRNIRLRNLDKVVFIGGTSENLKTQVKSLPNGYVTDNPQWSSVEGLFKIAVKKYVG